MIRLFVNNKRELWLNQNQPDSIINLEKWYTNSDGEYILESQEYISPGDMVMLMNYYRYQKENGLEIFE